MHRIPRPNLVFLFAQRWRERERGEEEGKKVIRISTMTLFHYAGAENLFLPPIDCAFGLGGCAGGRVGGGGEREGSGRLHPTDSG